MVGLIVLCTFLCLLDLAIMMNLEGLICANANYKHIKIMANLFVFVLCCIIICAITIMEYA